MMSTAELARKSCSPRLRRAVRALLEACEPRLLLSANFSFGRSLNPSGSITANAQITTMAYDNAGNLFVSGFFSGTLDANPTAPGTTTLASAGGDDILLAKYNPGGGLLWAKRFGSTGNDHGAGLAFDQGGNVYLTGYIDGTVSFGGASSPITSAGLLDAFIARFDNNGNAIWVRDVGGSNFDQGFGIAVTRGGTVYATGTFMGTADFDPGSGTQNLTDAGLYNNGYVLKLDVNGNFAWVRQISSAQDVAALTLALDSSGNVAVGGGFNGSATFGNVTLNTAGSNDAFIASYTSTGTLRWAKGLGGTSDDHMESVAFDASGNIYGAGYYRTSADLDPGAGVVTVSTSSPGLYNGFVVELSSSGNYVGSATLPSVDYSFFTTLTVAPSGKVDVGGYYGTNANAGAAGNLTAIGGADIVALQFAPGLGTVNWARSFGTAGNDQGYALASNAGDEVAMGGAFAGNMTIATAPATVLTSTGLASAFVTEISENSVTPTAPIGYVDVATAGYVIGWSWDANAGAGPVQIRVVIDGVPRLTKIASLSGRPDVTAYVGSDNHQFVIYLPALLAGQHTVSVYALDDNAAQSAVLLGTANVTSYHVYFDEQYYLAKYLDVAQAVTQGVFTSGWQHFSLYGQYENRSPSQWFDPVWYLQHYGDVASAVQSNPATLSAWSHYVNWGQFEHRSPNAYFDESWYLGRYTDVAGVVGVNNPSLPSGFAHYLMYGQYEPRSTSSSFDESYYLQHYLDIALAVRRGVLRSGFEHYLLYGATEGRITHA